MKTKSLVAGIILSVALAAPFAASALSIDDIQGQIRGLLEKVAALQLQIRQQTASSTVAVESRPVNTPSICGLLNRNLSRGQNGAEVRGLQEFLSTEGFLNVSATGFFGPATASALAKWQSENGISALGLFGPLSRERVRIWCGNHGNNLLSVTPQNGTAPLTVTITAKTGDSSDYRPSMADGQDTLIDFGDGSERQWVHCAVSPQDIYPSRCVSPVTFSHTYNSDGAYVVSIVKAGGMCIGGCAETTLASEKVLVGTTVTSGGSLNADPQSGSAPLPVSFTYQPGQENGQFWIEFGDGEGQVMNLRPIYCIRAPCISPVGANHTYTNAGTYEVYVTAYIACMHTNPRCLIATVPLARTVVTVTGSNSGGGSPVISGFSGPTSLGVNEIGTWRITASDPENGPLSYSVLWGDEWVAADAAVRSIASQASIQQDTTFTHSYSRAGSYTVALTVTDNTGKTARSTGTVQVATTVCTADYTPVCGRPTGCANTCAAGQYCTLQCQLYAPQTYSNRCQMNNSNATFMHEGACTGSEGYLQ